MITTTSLIDDPVKTLEIIDDAPSAPSEPTAAPAAPKKPKSATAKKPKSAIPKIPKGLATVKVPMCRVAIQGRPNIGHRKLHGVPVRFPNPAHELYRMIPQNPDEPGYVEANTLVVTMPTDVVRGGYFQRDRLVRILKNEKAIVLCKYPFDGFASDHEAALEFNRQKLFGTMANAGKSHANYTPKEWLALPVK